MDRQSIPTVDPRVKIGPMEQRAGTRYFLVKHTGTSRVFRIGEKEQFMLTCMDGTVDLDEISRRYEARFHNRMAEASWVQLFTIFRQRSLLVGSHPDNESEVPSIRHRFATSRQGLFEWKVQLISPHSLLAWIEQRLHVIFKRHFILLGVLLIFVSEAWVARHVHDIYSQLTQVGRGHWLILAVYVLPGLVASALIHEFAHALACRRLGGAVTDMGILFRYLSFYPYTRLDDVMLFHNRSHRIYVFAAGMYSTLLFGIPFIIAWPLLGDPYAKAASGVLIFALGFGTLINLVPFVQLDGYWILATLVQMPDLRQDSYILWKAILRRAEGMLPRWPTYSKRELTIAIIYGALSGAVSAFVTTVAVFRWHQAFARLGNIYAWLVVALLLTGFFLLKVRRLKTAASHHIGSRV